MPFFKLLGGFALYQDVAVVERFEISFDDVHARVVDPHATDAMAHT
jgi:hypothetical protein